MKPAAVIGNMPGGTIIPGIPMPPAAAAAIMADMSMPGMPVVCESGRG